MDQNNNFIAHLTQSAIIEVTGDDALTYLQGQLTNDINLVSNELSQYSAYCTPKGRMLCLFRVFKHGEKLLLIVSKDIVEKILKRLRMFVMMSKVELKDISESYSRLGVSGATSISTCQEQLINNEHLPSIINASITNNKLTWIKISNQRYECFGHNDDIANTEKQLLANNDISLLDSSNWELQQINDGLPDITEKTQDTFIPQMINLHALEGINFKKGCYTGQEVVARLHYLGKMKRLMYAIEFSSSVEPELGSKLYSPSSSSGQGAGKLVSLVKTAEDNYRGLAVLELSVVKSNDLFVDAEHHHSCKIITLPYTEQMILDNASES